MVLMRAFILLFLRTPSAFAPPLLDGSPRDGTFALFARGARGGRGGCTPSPCANSVSDTSSPFVSSPPSFPAPPAILLAYTARPVSLTLLTKADREWDPEEDAIAPGGAADPLTDPRGVGSLCRLPTAFSVTFTVVPISQVDAMRVPQDQILMHATGTQK